VVNYLVSFPVLICCVADMKNNQYQQWGVTRPGVGKRPRDHLEWPTKQLQFCHPLGNNSTNKSNIQPSSEQQPTFHSFYKVLRQVRYFPGRYTWTVCRCGKARANSALRIMNSATGDHQSWNFRLRNPLIFLPLLVQHQFNQRMTSSHCNTFHAEKLNM
jgi:hypothetical protein